MDCYQRLCLRIAFLLLAWTLWFAQPVQAQTYLLHETFDGSTLCVSGGVSNCDNTWTFGGGSLNYAYATAPAPLEGTKSLQLSGGSTNDLSINFTGSASKTYTSVIFEATTGGVNIFVPLMNTSGGGVNLGGLRLDWSTDHWSPRLFHSGLGSSTLASGTTISINQKWYFKVEYTPGSGSDAAWTLYAVQDSGGFPGWGTALVTITNATDTATYAQFDIQNAGTDVWIVDDIRVSTSDITYGASSPTVRRSATMQ